MNTILSNNDHLVIIAILIAGLICAAGMLAEAHNEDDEP